MFFGTEYEDECWCGDGDTDVEKNGGPAIATCDSACKGDATEMCGGFDAISAYEINDVAVVIGEKYTQARNVKSPLKKVVTNCKCPNECILNNV